MAQSRLADVARTTILAVLLRDDVDPARAAQHPRAAATTGAAGLHPRLIRYPHLPR